MDRTKKEWTESYKELLTFEMESVAGYGTTKYAVEPIIKELPNIFIEYNIKTFLDAPCSDYYIMKDFDFSGVQYIGIDIVNEQIQSNIEKYPNVDFRELDMIIDELPHVDLVFSRDILIHLSNDSINKFIKNCNNSNYIMVTTYTKINENEELTGTWRFINLEKFPFNFPPPLKLIPENIDTDFGKSMGIWKISDLLQLDLPQVNSQVNKNNIQEKPETGRNESFSRVIKILEEKYNEEITIVETGCIRGTSDTSKIGDGWSTLNWDYYAKKTNSKVYVVDINENHLNQSKKIVPPSDFVTYYKDDSVNFLNNFDKKIDLLFLDSYDYCGDAENIRKCHEHSLNEVKSAWDKLNDECFILIDDVFNDVNWAGKGELSIPYLLNNGFEIVYYIDSQVLLKR